MFKSKRAKILLSIFVVLILVGAGFATNAILNGTLSTFAANRDGGSRPSNKMGVGTITGNVTSNDGLSHDYTVFLLKKQVGGGYAGSGNIKTKGSYTFSNVATPATYRVMVYMSSDCAVGGGAGSPEVFLNAGRTETIKTLKLISLPYIKGQMTVNGKPPVKSTLNASPKISLKTNNITVASMSPDANGYYKFSCLAGGGNYNVSAAFNDNTQKPIAKYGAAYDVKLLSLPGSIIDFKF
ncbi:TPA: hypothetical protein DD449_03075 [Candidatus Berkelbacteria bacterium]|uniref:Uncharacterized protein n=1 Tax=Berkelbacteria bacterium GW2011_GWE1_39_12 TaxID=1618337 RepID=A0A0G4B3A0_9BACT|nr:MAG: hypothetical protein UT28_C0001G0244 [Berkelbacteria bacterium GW2011_GWE1_39_12]HBO60640.1 hypothetical protein [Candidatus Berkelbacteria bacterium]